jgi:homoserine kinase
VIRRRVVRVPASSANLGPGFDCMAAAVGLHLELEVRETGEFAVQTELPVAHGRENLCVRAFERLHSADGFAFTISSEIPLAGGLGSSAAATTCSSWTPTCSRWRASSRAIPTMLPQH